MYVEDDTKYEANGTILKQIRKYKIDSIDTKGQIQWKELTAAINFDSKNSVYQFSTASDNENILAFFDDSREIKIWDTGQEKLLSSFPVDSYYLPALSLNSDGSIVNAIGQTIDDNRDNYVLKWSTETWKLLSSVQIASGYAGAWVIDSQGTTVARFINTDRKIEITTFEPQLWRVGKDTEFIRIKKSCPELSLISLSMDGKLLALANGKGCIELHNTATLEHLITFNSHLTSLHGIALSPHGDYLAAQGNYYLQKCRRDPPQSFYIYPFSLYNA